MAVEVAEELLPDAFAESFIEDRLRFTPRSEAGVSLEDGHMIAEFLGE